MIWHHSWELERRYTSFLRHTKPVIVWSTGDNLVAEVLLTKGKSSLVDYEDIEDVCQYNWYASGTERYGYRATTDVNYRVLEGKKYKDHLFLHQLLTDTHKSVTVCDHINTTFPDSFELDNRKENLRVVHPRQNQKNRRLSVNNSSGYAGVVYSKKDNGYFGRVHFMDSLPYSPLFSASRFGGRDKETAALYCDSLRSLLREEEFTRVYTTGDTYVDSRIDVYLNRLRCRLSVGEVVRNCTDTGEPLE